MKTTFATAALLLLFSCKNPLKVEPSAAPGDPNASPTPLITVGPSPTGSPVPTASPLADEPNDN